MNARSRTLMHKVGAVAFFLLGFTLLVLAFGSVQLPGFWSDLMVSYHTANFSWWPQVNGLPPETYYSSKIYFTIAIGLALFLPQVETTFVSLIRRRSPIGAPYVDRTHFTCPVCGIVNRPSVQFCVKCGSQIFTGTRHWDARQSGGARASSFLKVLLGFSAAIGIFLGCFDTTIYSYLTNIIGINGATVLVAAIASVVPSIAGYVALKEGPFRKYASLKQFDRYVFGSEIWLVFGLFFILLAIPAVISGAGNSPGLTVLTVMQGLLGVLMISYPPIRRRFARPGTQTISFDDSRVW